MEKKNKRKFWGTLTSFVLTFMFISSWAVLGVALALKNAEVNLGGNITFTSKEIQALVSLTKAEGVNESLESLKTNCPDITMNAETTSITDWSQITLTFSDAGTGKTRTATLEVTIKNKNSTKAVDLTVEKIDGTSAGITMTVDTTSATIAADESKVVKITFTLADANADASLNGWNVKFLLSNVHVG